MIPENEPTKVENIIIPTSKLFKLVRSLDEQRKQIPKDTNSPKLKLARYRLKILHDVLNSLLNNYGIDKLFERYLRDEEYVNELAEAIDKDD